MGGCIRQVAVCYRHGWEARLGLLHLGCTREVSALLRCLLAQVAALLRWLLCSGGCLHKVSMYTHSPPWLHGVPP